VNAQRYPLSWPAGWKRTPASVRKRSQFRATETHYGSAGGSWKSSKYITVAVAIDRLAGELRRLGIDGIDDFLLSSNMPVRLDGLPRSGQAEPTDPGVAVYFRLHGQDRCLACDRWDRVADNIAAIAAHVSAIRAVDRYGVGTLDQAFAGYAALPAPATPDEWWRVLGVAPTASPDEVDAAFKARAREAHPDVGGSHDEMARLSAARDAARKAAQG
jgi:hypothetical protein